MHDLKLQQSLTVRAQLALGASQEGLGELLGVARRTVTRWAAGASHPSEAQLAQLAQLTYSVDPGLAAQLAASIGASLVSLGIVTPPEEGGRVAGQAARTVAVDVLVDAILCSTAEATALHPNDVRPALRLALERARSMGITLDELLRGLTPAAPPPPPPVVPDEKPRARKGREQGK